MGAGLRGDSHTVGDERRAGAKALPINFDPAILARAHHTEPGPTSDPELKSAKAAALREDCGKHGIPRQTFDGHAIDHEADGAAVAPGHADKL
jgi:hypothetical protein